MSDLNDVGRAALMDLLEAAQDWTRDCCDGNTNLSGPNIGQVECPEGEGRCALFRAVTASSSNRRERRG